MAIINTNFERRIVALYVDNVFLFGQNLPTNKRKPDRRSSRTSGQPLRNWVFWTWNVEYVCIIWHKVNCSWQYSCTQLNKRKKTLSIFNAIYTVLKRNWQSSEYSTHIPVHWGRAYVSLYRYTLQLKTKQQ